MGTITVYLSVDVPINTTKITGIVITFGIIHFWKSKGMNRFMYDCSYSTYLEHTPLKAGTTAYEPSLYPPANVHVLNSAPARAWLAILCCDVTPVLQSTAPITPSYPLCTKIVKSIVRS